MYCPKCGAEIDEDHHYCTACGHPISDEAEETSSLKPEAHRHSPTWFYLLVITVLSLMLWGFYASYNSGKELESVVTNQLNEVKEKKITKAYYEYSSSEFKKNNTLDSFRDFIAKNPALSEFKDIRILNSQQESQYGTVLGELDLMDDESIPVKYEFVKEEDEWRVLGIQLGAPKMVKEHEAAEKIQVVSLIQNQLDTMKKGQMNTAYNDFSTSNFKANVTIDDFEKFIASYPALTTFKKIDFPKSEILGDRASVTAIIYYDHQTLPLEYILLKKEGAWKIWSIHILTSTNEESAVSTKYDPASLVEPINVFLEDLKEGDLDKAYQSTSTTFQKKTSHDAFKKFIERFPIFSHSTSTVIKQKIQGDVGQITVELKGPEGSAWIDYIVSKEGDAWKIWGVQIDKQSTAKPVAADSKEMKDFDASFLFDVIRKQLKKINEKDLIGAYQEYSSVDFKASTPFDAFADFINTNPIFKDHESAQFKDLSFNNNIATIQSNITGKDGTISVIEYDLVKEEDQWKILGIKILNANNKDSEESH